MNTLRLLVALIELPPTVHGNESIYQRYALATFCSGDLDPFSV